MVINKTNEDLRSELSLSGFDPGRSAQVYRYGEANLRAIVRQPDQTVGADGFNAAYPAYPITLFVVPEGR